MMKSTKKVPRPQAYRNETSVLNESNISNVDQAQVHEVDNEEAVVIEAFKNFDVDGDGFVSVREFVSMMKNYAPNLTPNDVDEIVKESKLDVKGKMDYREFVEFWKNMN